MEYQVTLAHNCREMAGTAGTALHLAMFMRTGGRVYQIKRNSTESDNIATEKFICDLCNLDLFWIYGSIETVPTKHFTNVPQIVGITQYLKKFFDDNNFKYSQKDLCNDKDEFIKYKHQYHIYKLKRIIKKCLNPVIKIIALFGVTKQGRSSIIKYLYKLLKV